MGEAGGERMPGQMIDRHQRLAAGQGQGLRRGQAHHHPADQARSGGGGDGIDLVQRHVGVRQRTLDQSIQYFHMGAGGDFRYHPAIGGVGFVLAEDLAGKDFPRTGRQAPNHRGGGFVATGFQA